MKFSITQLKLHAFSYTRMFQFVNTLINIFKIYEFKRCAGGVPLYFLKRYQYWRSFYVVKWVETWFTIFFKHYVTTQLWYFFMVFLGSCLQDKFLNTTVCLNFTVFYPDTEVLLWINKKLSQTHVLHRLNFVPLSLRKRSRRRRILNIHRLE